MNKKPSAINSLLAARPTALRRAPIGNKASHLRISHNDGSIKTPAPAPPAPESRITRETLTGMVRSLDVALAGVHAILLDFIDRAEASASSRRSPRVIADLQALADRMVREIDRIAQSTVIDGRHVLCGPVYGNNPARLDGPNYSLPLNCMMPGALGPDPVRTLASLRAGGRSSLLVTSVEQAVEIARHAVAQVSVQRVQLANFARRESLLDPSTTDIADENRRAAQSANEQGDFIEMVGALSRGQALAGMLASKNGRKPGDENPSLSISREPPR